MFQGWSYPEDFILYNSFASLVECSVCPLFLHWYEDIVCFFSFHIIHRTKELW